MPQSSERANTAPASTAPLPLGDGRTVRLSDYLGRWLVLYFYPKDNTPGCTLEGIDFNALLPAFRKAGADILGVSRDSVKSHAGFCARHGFDFDLVSDPDDTLGGAFDVIREKSLYGRRFIGIERSTFLLDPQGQVAAQWRKVKVAGHADTVLATLLQRIGATPADPGAATHARPTPLAKASKAAKSTGSATPARTKVAQATKTATAAKAAKATKPSKAASATKATPTPRPAKRAPAKKAGTRK